MIFTSVLFMAEVIKLLCHIGRYRSWYLSTDSSALRCRNRVLDPKTVCLNLSNYGNIIIP